MSTNAKVTRPGCRPFCKKLILEEGIINEEQLLERVHTQFPDKKDVFTKYQVRFELRLAGKLPWTGRKGKKPTR